MRFYTHKHAQTHIYRPLPCLLTLIPPSLCISYELSEKTQWIEWQRSKARPSNRPGWRGDGWLCVYESVHAYICLRVCLSHTVRIVCACVSEYEYVSFHHVLCFHPTKAFSPYFAARTVRMHTRSSPFLSTLKCGRRVKWQVFNQCWPPHATELICWTRLNPHSNLPPSFHLIHPLTGKGCHTQVTGFRDSLTNNMWEVEGWRREEDNKEWEVLCLQ